MKTSTLPRKLRALTLACVAVLTATQLTGCFPVLAGAMAGGVTSATDRRPTSTQTVDRGLQLEADSTLSSRYPDSAARVSVTVYNRKVLLTGEANNQGTKDQIEQYVRALPNTREVVDDLQIVPSPSFATRSEDTYITSKVKTLLVTGEGVPSNSIKVVTEKGTVYLLGVVTQPEGDRATEVTRNVSGVTKVVKAFDYVSEAEKDRLDKNASSQNTNYGSTSDGQSSTSGLQPAFGGSPGSSTQLAPVSTTSGVSGATASSPAAASSAPVTSSVVSPVALPPGRNLP